jgi:hypothetical protein
MIFTGLVKYPKISAYWSRFIPYPNTFVPAVMTRNTFRDILRFLHFDVNEFAGDDQLAKIRRLISLLVEHFIKFKTPGAITVIDETMVPFRGRLVFKQYMPGKAKTYSVKLFKFCDSKGYAHTSLSMEAK